MNKETLPPWEWAVIIILAGLILAVIGDVTRRLWHLRRDNPGPPPYDWKQDDGWLDVIARDDEGEVTAILPIWHLKIGAGTREW